LVPRLPDGSRDRIGKARIASWAMVMSGACRLAAGLVFNAPPPAIVAFAVIWGIAVVADSAQLSALVAQYSPRDHVGTALTLQTCIGSVDHGVNPPDARGRTTSWMAVGLRVSGARNHERS